MGQASLELSRIPSAQIAEWRTLDGLRKAHFASETLQTYSNLHAMAGEYLGVGFPDLEDQAATSNGIAIAEVAHFREASLGLTEFPDVYGSDFVVMTLVKKMGSDNLAFTKESIDRVERGAHVTVQSFERIAAPHVDGDERRLKLARRGAAFMHSLLADVADVATAELVAAEERQRQASFRAPVISLVERLAPAR